MRSLYLIIIMSAVFSVCRAADEPAVKPEELLKASMFPDAQFGMSIENVVDGDTAKVTTTGAEFVLHKKDDQIECIQRIVEGENVMPARSVAVLRFPAGSLGGVKLIHSTSGAAIFEGAGATVRINGDSLLMVRPSMDGMIEARLNFLPDYYMELKGNFNFFDTVGGISFFEHGKHPDAKMNIITDPVMITWSWKGGDVFWAAVSPPKKFDWARSTQDRIVVHASSEDRFMYPGDIVLNMMARQGNILYLHNELMWEGPELEFVPKNKKEYLRVMQTAKELGLKTMVYASPHFFLKGTSLESLAASDPHKFQGNFVGSNAHEYLEQVKRLVRDFNTDGIYFDEIYTSIPSLATSYYVTRSVRQIIGDENPLCYHATTDALGGGHYDAYFPTLHAYANFVLKGEGEWDTMDPAYIRYNLCTYGISNAVGMQIFDERSIPSPEKLDYFLRKGNLRFYFLTYWMFTDTMNLFRHHYWPYLDPNLIKYHVKYDIFRPTGVFTQYRNYLKTQMTN